MSVNLKEPTFEDVAFKVKKVIEGGVKLEKILKFVAAVLEPFHSKLPVFFLGLEKGCSGATEISGGLKVFGRPYDWMKRKWSESGARGFVQLGAFSGAQALSTVKLVFKYSLLFLPTPVALAKESLFIVSFTILTFDEAIKLRKISKQMDKVADKLQAADGKEITRLEAKLIEGDESEKMVKVRKRLKQMETDDGKLELNTIRLNKVTRLSALKSDSSLNIAYNVSMIALCVFSIIATFFLVTQPYVLIGFTVIGIAAAALAVVKAFRKDE